MLHTGFLKYYKYSILLHLEYFRNLTIDRRLKYMVYNIHTNQACNKSMNYETACRTNIYYVERAVKLRLYVITSKDTKKCLQGFYTTSDLKAIVPYKQYCIETGTKAQLDEVMLSGKLRRVYG